MNDPLGHTRPVHRYDHPQSSSGKFDSHIRFCSRGAPWVDSSGDLQSSTLHFLCRQAIHLSHCRSLGGQDGRPTREAILCSILARQSNWPVERSDSIRAYHSRISTPKERPRRGFLLCARSTGPSLSTHRRVSLITSCYFSDAKPVGR